MIIGAHILIQSRDDGADKAFLTDVLKLSFVDADGGSFRIFGLPPSELAVHESDKNDTHELFLMCDDIEAFANDMARRGIACTEPAERGWGTLVQVTLPGGGKLGVYQPHHERPTAKAAAAKKKKKAPKNVQGRKAARKPAKKKVAKKKTAKKSKAKRR